MASKQSRDRRVGNEVVEQPFGHGQLRRHLAVVGHLGEEGSGRHRLAFHVGQVRRQDPAFGRTLHQEALFAGEAALECRVQRGAAAFVGVFLFTLLMVSREGMETALLLIQLRQTANLAAGALIGVAGAAALAWLWSRVGHRINLGLFFQVTAIFLCVFVVQLVIFGVHEMSEQRFLPFSEAIHTATESWGPDSTFGHVLTYSLVILPLAWLGVKAVFSKAPVIQTVPREQRVA